MANTNRRGSMLKRGTRKVTRAVRKITPGMKSQKRNNPGRATSRTTARRRTTTRSRTASRAR